MTAIIHRDWEFRMGTALTRLLLLFYHGFTTMAVKKMSEVTRNRACP